VIRIAAVGDLHADRSTAPRWRAALAPSRHEADVLLLAGDLTQDGEPGQAHALADALCDLGLPIVAVLGNHDVDRDRADAVRKALEGHGVVVLDGEAIAIDTRDGRLGIAGTKGFGGGFDAARASDFGEPEMKAFVRAARVSAESLERALRAVPAPRVALLHYAPCHATLVGEAPGVVPFLGSQLLEEAVDRTHTALAVHGHAHSGRELGRTRGGVPVRNVARPVIGRAYRVYCLPGGDECPSRAPAAPPPGDLPRDAPRASPR
jgi:Icc-related predicted phosphoesterase